MPRFEDYLSPEILEKMRQVGETSDIDRIAQKYIKNEALSSSEIDLLNKNPERLHLALKNKPFIPSSNFEKIVQRLEPSMKMSTETPNISSKLQALEAPASAAQKIAQTAEVASKSNRLKDVIGKLAQSSDDALTKISTPLKNVIASSRLLNTGLPALGAYTEGRDAVSSLQKGDYTGAAGHALSAGGSAALIPEVGGLAGGVIGLGAPLAIGTGASILGYKYLKENSDLPQVASELKARNMSPYQLAKGGDPYAPTKEQEEAIKQNEEINKRADSAIPLTKKELEDLQGGNSSFIPAKKSSEENLNAALDSIKKSDSTDNKKSDVPDAEKEKSPLEDFLKIDAEQRQGVLDALKEAQGQSRQEKADARLMMAADKILRGALGASKKVIVPEGSNEFWESKIKGSDQAVKDLLVQQEMEKEDPNSPISKRMREIAKPMFDKLNMTMPEVSYNTIKENFPQFTKMYDSQIVKDLSAEKKQQEQTFKLEKEDTKRFDKLSKEMDPSRASGRSQLGVDAKNVAVIENAKALLAGTKNLNDIDSRQVYEVVRLLDRVVSGGNPTISASEHLDPQTFQRQFQSFWEKFTNERKGAKAGSFLKANIETFDRELEKAKQRLENSARAATASYKDLMEKYPEKWDEIMADHGYGHILSVDKIKELREQRKQKAQDHKPGDIVEIEGKKYKVLSDGDSLEEIK